MANLTDISTAAYINLTSVLTFLLAFAFLRLQPINDRVFFPKWYLKGARATPKTSGVLVKKFVNLDVRTYLKFWTWMPEALKMPEPELIEHAGLDSVAYIRIYLLGLKIFVPIATLAFALLVPINCTGGTLEDIKDLTFSDIDKLSISNVPAGSLRFLAHVVMAYVVTFWTCYVLYKEYESITNKRLHFIALAKRRPEQFTVLVVNIPPESDESVSEQVEHFFRVNHPDNYLFHQVVYNTKHLAKLVEAKKRLRNWLNYYEMRFERNTKRRPRTRTGLWGLFGKSVDAMDYFLIQEVAEREKVMKDPSYIFPAAFVSFKCRWGAAVCAQTQQTSNPTAWLTEWAPEPSDIVWDNISIPYFQLSIKRQIVAISMFFLTFFFMIPIAFVQSLASLDGIQKVLPFLTPLIRMLASLTLLVFFNGKSFYFIVIIFAFYTRKNIKAIVQGFLPGVALKAFMAVLPGILTTMSRIEGYTSISALERRTASKYHLFILVNVFFGSIITGAAFQQLHKFINQPPSEIPKTIGVAIPMKATFFITYVMVDGWAGIAAEIIRLVPLIVFHLKNTFMVKTSEDREQAMDPGSVNFATTEPRIQLYFILGLVYSVVTPLILPFIIVFFAFSYTIYRHQIINVYDQKYESGARFWPDVHRRVLLGLILSQILLMGLLSTKNAAKSTPLLLILVVLTIWFSKFCKGRFES